ncbi:MAG TPA: c-type cytochrome, partial [Candidatus Tenderia electrophaga]|nr:c-type cytochrome [Candidatus Tenderia electrophaga]
MFAVMRNFSIVALLLGLVGCDQATIFSSAVAEPNIAQLPLVGDASKGWRLAKQCAECHGLDGASARSGAPFIAGLEQEYLIRSMLAYRNGARNHADMKQASEALNSMALADVTAYYAGLETDWQGAVADKQSRSILWNDKARREAQHIVESCRSCHSQVNRYQKKEAIPNLDGMPAEYFIPTLKSYVTGGRHNDIMVNFKSRLSDADIYNLAAYFAARTPQKSQPPEAGDPVKGKIAARACAGCHGFDGNSLNPHIPNLAGQSFRYLVKASKDYRDGVRHSQLMQAPLQRLSDTTIVNLAAYFSRQTPQSQLHKDLASDKAFNPLADGKKIAASCGGCHGEDGNSRKAGVPSLTGMHVKYIVRATQAYQHGLRQHP